jgi:hypothetical protein
MQVKGVFIMYIMAAHIANEVPAIKNMFDHSFDKADVIARLAQADTTIHYTPADALLPAYVEQSPDGIFGVDHPLLDQPLSTHLSKRKAEEAVPAPERALKKIESDNTAVTIDDVVDASSVSIPAAELEVVRQEAVNMLKAKTNVFLSNLETAQNYDLFMQYFENRINELGSRHSFFPAFDGDAAQKGTTPTLIDFIEAYQKAGDDGNLQSAVHDYLDYSLAQQITHAEPETQPLPKPPLIV